jgi:acyl-CoA thioesterase
MSDTGPTALADVADLIRSFDLRKVGDQAFEAPAFDCGEHNVVEGSHILGQAVVACSRLLGQRAVSVYGTFSRPALWNAPLRFEVETAHQGRSFSTAAVAVLQGGRRTSSVIVLLGADAPDLVRQQAAMPEVPAPATCEPQDRGLTGREIRVAPAEPSAGGVRPAEANVWLRLHAAPEEPCLRQAMVMELMGAYTLLAAMRPHPKLDIRDAHVGLATGVLAMGVSLYEDADLADWLLYTNAAGYTGRGLAQVDGRVFERQGRLAASSTATCMLRRAGVQPARG